MTKINRKKVDITKLIRVNTYVQRSGLTRQGAWYQINNNLVDWLQIDGTVFIILKQLK